MIIYNLKGGGMFYRFLCGFFACLFGGVLYIASNIMADLSGATNVEFWIDKKIPFIPEFVFVYLFLFIYLIFPVIFIKYNSYFNKLIEAFIVMVCFSILIFIIFPTQISRPEICSGGFYKWLFYKIRFIDGPYNCAPSLHVSCAILIALTMIKYLKNKFFQIINIVIALVIIISTLLIKQHTVIDVVTGGVLSSFIYLIFLKRARC